MVIFVFCGVSPVLAEIVKPDLRTQLGAQILRAAKHDTSLTDHEKLFVHHCKTIEKYVGFSNTALDKAIEYSCNHMFLL